MDKWQCYYANMMNRHDCCSFEGGPPICALAITVNEISVVPSIGHNCSNLAFGAEDNACRGTPPRAVATAASSCFNKLLYTLVAWSHSSGSATPEPPIGV